MELKYHFARVGRHAGIGSIKAVDTIHVDSKHRFEDGTKGHFRIELEGLQWCAIAILYPAVAVGVDGFRLQDRHHGFGDAELQITPPWLFRVIPPQAEKAY